MSVVKEEIRAVGSPEGGKMENWPAGALEMMVGAMQGPVKKYSREGKSRKGGP